MTTTASAPISAACAARVTVSAVVCAPQWTATRSRPSAACRKRSATRRRSSTRSRIPSPAVPSARTPSSPASDVEIGQRLERGVVDLGSVLAQWRHRCREHTSEQRHQRCGLPSRAPSTVAAIRRVRVSGRFASSIQSTYCRWWEYESFAKAALATESAASASRRSARHRDLPRLGVEGHDHAYPVACVDAGRSLDLPVDDDVPDSVVHAGRRPPCVVPDRHLDRRPRAAERLLEIERHAEHRRRRPDPLEHHREALRLHERNLKVRIVVGSGSSATGTSSG